MIDALNFADTLQRPVLQLGPDTAHLFNFDTAGLRGIQHPRLGREPLRLKPPRAGQNVRMMVPLIALTMRRMDRHIDGNTVAADELLGELARDLRPVLDADLGW